MDLDLIQDATLSLLLTYTHTHLAIDAISKVGNRDRHSWEVAVCYYCAHCYYYLLCLSLAFPHAMMIIDNSFFVAFCLLVGKSDNVWDEQSFFSEGSKKSLFPTHQRLNHSSLFFHSITHFRQHSHIQAKGTAKDEMTNRDTGQDLLSSP